jgi:hypothetical protein
MVGLSGTSAVRKNYGAMEKNNPLHKETLLEPFYVTMMDAKKSRTRARDFSISERRNAGVLFHAVSVGATTA